MQIWGDFMLFKSTRGGEVNISSSEAILKGIAKDGGLFVPSSFPEIYSKLKDKVDYGYEELAEKIIGQYFTDISNDDLVEAINDAYKGRFNVEVKSGFLELYHGPTSAFKDAALLFLPQIMKKAKKVVNFKNEIVILTATSGDTGKAALEGFKDVEGFKVIVYYPKSGVSEVQEKQMRTQRGNNVFVVAIEGNFDDAQRGVKTIFSNKELKEDLEKNNILLSSANSINIGRLVPQIVYYFYGYFKLVSQGEVKEGDKINVAVPTGNFGNILAAYYAKQMGLPIDKLICASNENNVLTDFFNEGTYDKNRELILTESPSMDILVSSNLERLLYELSDRDSEKVEKLMNSLQSSGKYSITEEMKEKLSDFYGDYSEIEEVYEVIRDVYNKDSYLMDTHTAVAYSVYKKYQEKTGDNKKVLIASTASPFKFNRSIINALGIKIDGEDDLELLNKLSSYTSLEIPAGLKELKDLPILHNIECPSDKMEATLKEILKVGV
jgi:threonine synthase